MARFFPKRWVWRFGSKSRSEDRLGMGGASADDWAKLSQEKPLGLILEFPSFMERSLSSFLGVHELER